MRNTVFISDLHLSADQPKITELFLNFLANGLGDAESLYILGDFFALWVGDDYVSLLSEKIKSALKKLTIPVYLMPGNRDFIIGKIFAKDTGATLISDPHLIDLYGKSTLLTHGDILCTADYIQRIFRYCVQGHFARKLFLKLSLKVRLKLADFVRKFSARNNKRKSVQLMDVSQKEVRKLMELYKAALIIHGHTHKAGVYGLNFDGEVYQRIVIPNWLPEHGGFLRYYENGTFEFVDV